MEDNLYSKIDAAASRLGIEEYSGRRSSVIPRGFGLCSKCKNFEYVVTEFNVLWATCGYFGGEITRLKLTQIAPVRDCTHFDELGTMTLKDMSDIASVISGTLPEKIGFKK